MDDFYTYFVGYAFLSSRENIYRFKFIDNVERIKHYEIK